MKKIVRLTESQLHRLIEQTLNELDWRTYMNASQKSAYQIPDLYDQSLEEFGKAYNESNWDKPGHGGHSAKYKQLQNKIKKRAQQSNTFAQGATDAYRRKYGVDDINLYPPSEDYPMGCIGVPSKDKRMADIDRFHDFLYRDKYTKGKGWNESLARRVMEGVIRQVLNEYDERDDWDDEDYDEKETTENVKGETIGKYKINTHNDIIFVSDSLENADYDNIVECLGKLIVYSFSDVIGFGSDPRKLNIDTNGMFTLNKVYTIRFPRVGSIAIYMCLLGEAEYLEGVEDLGGGKTQLCQGYCKPLKLTIINERWNNKPINFVKNNIDWDQLDKYVYEHTQWGGY